MPSQPDDAVWLIADPTEGQPGGRIIVNLVDASAAMELARDLTHEIHDLTDQESWTDEDETTPGHECWAVEWAEDAGWDTVTAADGILSSVDVEVTYDEGVVVDLTPPQPTLPDLAEPSDAEVRAAAEESEHHEQWGYDENGFPHCECGASLVESEHDLSVVPSLMAHQARAALVAARKAARHE